MVELSTALVNVANEIYTTQFIYDSGELKLTIGFYESNRTLTAASSGSTIIHIHNLCEVVVLPLSNSSMFMIKRFLLLPKYFECRANSKARQM